MLFVYGVEDASRTSRILAITYLIIFHGEI